MAETTLKIAREIAKLIRPNCINGPTCRDCKADRNNMARLITEKLTPLVEAAEAVVEAPKGTLPHYVVGLHRELARIKGDNNGK